MEIIASGWPMLCGNAGYPAFSRLGEPYTREPLTPGNGPGIDGVIADLAQLDRHDLIAAGLDPEIHGRTE